MNELLAQTWDHGQLSNGGPHHEALEMMLARKLHAPELALTTNGTAALMLAFKALGLTGDVVTVAYTFPASFQALGWAGLRPVWCDIDPVRLSMDPAGVASAVTPATSAILAIHPFGSAADVKGLDAVGTELGLPVIYDAAQGFGVSVGGHPLAEWGAAICWSFHATKVFHTGEGGAVHLADQGTALRALRNHGIAADGSIVDGGLNAKLGELPSALGICVLEKLEEELEDRGGIAAIYDSGFDSMNGVERPFTPPDVTRNWSYYPIRVESAKAVESHLRSAGIRARRFFSVETVDFAEAGGVRLPYSRAAASEVVCLPIHGEMSEADAEVVVSAVSGAVRF